MEEREDEEKEQYFSCLCNRALNQSAHKDLFSLQGRKKVAAIDIEEHHLFSFLWLLLVFQAICLCQSEVEEKERKNENSFPSQFRTHLCFPIESCENLWLNNF